MSFVYFLYIFCIFFVYFLYISVITAHISYFYILIISGIYALVVYKARHKSILPTYLYTYATGVIIYWYSIFTAVLMFTTIYVYRDFIYLFLIVYNNALYSNVL